MSVLLRALKITVAFVAVAAIAFIISQTVVENELIAEDDCDHCESRPDTKLSDL